MSDTIEQPKIDVQRLLSELENSEPETVEIDGRKTSIGWLHKDTESRISHLMTRERIPTEKKMVMWYALVRLDTRYGLLTYLTKAVSWIYWRWLWYVKRERCTRFQMMVIAASKKKNSGAVKRIRAEYHIDDRGYGHDDDEGSSRSWPSRTRWGMNHSIAEKYPFLFDRLLWIREYGWRFGYTSAQIDLMIADRPVTDYKTDRRSKGSLIATKGEVDELDNLVEEWSKKRNGRTFVGEKFSLDGFLGGKINNKK